MKVTIEGNAKEIAELVLPQTRQQTRQDFEGLNVNYNKKDL